MKVFPPVRLFYIIILRVGQSSASAPRSEYGGVRDRPEHSLSQIWLLEGGVQHNKPGNRTIGLYHSHLAIGALEKEGRRSPWCSEDRTRGSIST